MLLFDFTSSILNIDSEQDLAFVRINIIGLTETKNLASLAIRRAEGPQAMAIASVHIKS